MVFLIGERVILRPLEQEDIGGAYAIWINDQKSDIFTEHALFPHSRQN